MAILRNGTPVGGFDCCPRCPAMSLATSRCAHSSECVPLIVLHQRCAGSVFVQEYGFPPLTIGMISSTTKLQGSGYLSRKSIGLPQIPHVLPLLTAALCLATSWFRRVPFCLRTFGLCAVIHSSIQFRFSRWHRFGSIDNFNSKTLER